MQDPKVRARRTLRGADRDVQCRHGGAGSLQQTPAIHRPRGPQHRINQLPHDPVRELLLELAPGRAQHAHPARPRLTPRHVPQHRLADPRRALHQQHAAHAINGIPQRNTNPSEFPLTLKQTQQLSGLVHHHPTNPASTAASSSYTRRHSSYDQDL